MLIKMFAPLKCRGNHETDGIVMDNILHKEILTKAFFVAGANSRFRDQNDPVALSAVKDAEEFLATLPAGTPKPDIHAGATSAPDKIVSFSWLDFGTGRIKGVYVSCKGNGLYDAAWDSQDASGGSQSSITLIDLVKLDIAHKIKSMKAQGPMPTPTIP